MVWNKVVSNRKKRYIERRIRKKVGKAISDYTMISQGNKILVAISGGKDSIVLLKVLTDIKILAPIDFNLIPVHLETGFIKGFEKIVSWARDRLGIEIVQIDTNISKIIEKVSDPGKSPCGICSRLRRGYLYSTASKLGISSVALGHHMDDIIETFLLRLFYTGQIGAMAPSRISNDEKNRVIRPLAYCPVDLVDAYFSTLEIDPAKQVCPLRKDSKREMIREYISGLEKDIPFVKYSMFAALGNIDSRSMCLREV